jgi:Flp pilus assembly protein protease CpaA
MSMSTSLLLIIVGAVLRYAVTAHVSGIDLQTAGSIVIVVGIVGLVISLLFAARGWLGGPRSFAP